MKQHICLGAAALLVGAALGCGDDGSAPARPSAFGDRVTHLDLLATAHLLDVDYRGTFIDFGTAARLKYTVGQWRTGWVADRTEGETTYSDVGLTGRVFFQVDEAGPLTIRFRARAVGSRNMTVFLNNHQQPLVRLAEGHEFRNYDLTVEADAVKRGENYLLLRFGGVSPVGGHDVSAAMESIRIVSGTEVPAGTYEAPRFDRMVRDVTVDGHTRRALTARIPTTLSAYIQVPRGGVLGFSVGAPVDSSGARARIVITPAGGDSVEVYSSSISGDWHEEILSLERFEGRVVRVDVSAQGGRGTVAWSALSVLTPPIELPERRPAKNVVLLLEDTLPAHKLRPYNPRSRVRTPVFDRLVGSGILFEHAQSPENWTKPSVASILTGLYPATHGAKTSEARLPASALLLSEHLGEHGFATAAFIANGYVSDKFGFDQGWDHYTNYIREDRSREAEDVFREAAEWIAQHKDERFFVFVQTIDPHVPYDPPAQFLSMYDDRAYTGQVRPRATPDLLEKAKRNPPLVTFDASDRRRLGALYDGEVSYHDRELGVFLERLERLGVRDDTLLVVTSDHGEEFGEHGSWGHGHSIYQELLHVPLLFHRPGGAARAVRVTDTVSTLSIPATVLSETGVEPMPAEEGGDLTVLMAGGVRPGPAVAFSDFLDDRRTIVAGRWKLVLRGINATLFDLEDDPGEQRELDRHEHPVAMRYCRIMLGQFLGSTDRRHWLDARQGPGTVLRREDATMDGTTREQLRALGYAN